MDSEKIGIGSVHKVIEHTATNFFNAKESLKALAELFLKYDGCINEQLDYSQINGLGYLLLALSEKIDVDLEDLFRIVHNRKPDTDIRIVEVEKTFEEDK